MAGVGSEATLIEDVLEFWFERPATDGAELRRKIKRWYMGGAEVDAQIRARFGALVERALAGELDAWARTTRGRLALILVLDQFTRSLYRDDPRAYAGDAKASALALEAYALGLDRELSLEERTFLAMPLVHAEDRAVLERAVDAMEALVADASDWQAEVFAMGVEQARKYRDVIARYGRFPHRNRILGRASTPEETAFLADWEAQARPSGAEDL